MLANSKEHEFRTNSDASIQAVPTHVQSVVCSAPTSTSMWRPLALGLLARAPSGSPLRETGPLECHDLRKHTRSSGCAQDSGAFGGEEGPRRAGQLEAQPRTHTHTHHTRSRRMLGQAPKQRTKARRKESTTSRQVSPRADGHVTWPHEGPESGIQGGCERATRLRARRPSRIAVPSVFVLASACNRCTVLRAPPRNAASTSREKTRLIVRVCEEKQPRLKASEVGVTLGNADGVGAR